VVPEVTGLLIPPGYPEAISEAVVKLLRNPELRRRMGQAGRAWVLEHFVDRRVLGLATAYYKMLLESAPAHAELDPAKAWAQDRRAR
jgi:glycosyltransferase involved in cell wall biosynthesis